MRKFLMTFVLALTASAGMAQQKAMDQYINGLMSKMTLKEKIGQLNLMVAGDITTGGKVDTKVANDILNGNMGGVFNVKGVDKIRALQDIAVKKSRMHIPLLVGMDVIHGYETIFPIPLGASCSWDIPAIERSAHIAAKEASADGIDWTYSPMVDIALDSRWGRVCEGSGEDPYLGSRIAEAMVCGYQGDYSSKENIMACLKHFALYGAVEAGKEYNTVDMSHLRMYNQYFPPYKAAVDAGVGSVMSSFNLVDGIPATANKWLLTDVLRNQWHFKGFVVTDYGSIGEITNHGLGNLQNSSVMALKAGTDMDMCSQGFVSTLEKSLAEGKVSIADIDTACRRVLEAKYKLGLFKNPYKYLDASRRKRDIFTAQNRAIARSLATESFVLLKNEGNLLPLQKKGKIALIGPLANTRANMAGTWCVSYTPDKYSTLKEGLERALGGKAQLLYAQGSNLTADAALQKAAEFGKTIPRGDDQKLKEEALKIARQSDVIIAAMGECADMSGESSSRTDLDLPDVQMSLLRDLVATGKPVVLLNFSGRATVLKWESEHANAIINVWFGGSEAADAICDVLFGDVNPSGKLTVSMPQVTGQEPLYYNHLPTGRPVPDGTKEFRKYASNYLDVRNDALYPFGYGLSYTTYQYGDIRLSSDKMASDGSITATINVKNTGSRDGDEIVQLYIHDQVAGVSRPVKELKGFQRIHLSAGESKDVTFEITPGLLKYYNYNLEYVLDPGTFDLMIGPNSSNLKTVSFTVM
ncbi:MAG: beta-glucosidase BglX [Prevotella sp.]|jgi:beta-glucosidase|nr:beta-glucosidase BglX [Prevotella sp.]MCH4182044.1 beta-glucosidase BglX [Prevotella sp.]MCH4211878.1 beta-glucosidase BglX [Prevotella sp.]MCH4241006.1 beta-glucosidase BglX [Prevotella sp.]